MPTQYKPKPPSPAAVHTTLLWCGLMLESYRVNLLEAQRAGAAVDPVWISEASEHERTLKALAVNWPTLVGGG